MTRMEHEGNVSPWLQMAEDNGLIVKWLEFDRDSWVVEPPMLEALITDRTKLLALNYASNLTGGVNDVKTLTAMAHAAGAQAEAATYLVSVKAGSVAAAVEAVDALAAAAEAAAALAAAAEAAAAPLVHAAWPATPGGMSSSPCPSAARSAEADAPAADALAADAPAVRTRSASFCAACTLACLRVSASSLSSRLLSPIASAAACSPP